MSHHFPYFGWVNLLTGASYNFKAPRITEDAGKKTEIPFPTAAIVKPEGDTATVSVCRQTTYVRFGRLNANGRLNLSVEADNLAPGALLTVSWASGETKCDVIVNLGAGLTLILLGTALERVTKQLVWDGEGFLAL